MSPFFLDNEGGKRLYPRASPAGLLRGRRVPAANRQSFDHAGKPRLSPRAARQALDIDANVAFGIDAAGLIRLKTAGDIARQIGEAA
jgi:hypothetical protein